MELCKNNMYIVPLPKRILLEDKDLVCRIHITPEGDIEPVETLVTPSELEEITTDLLTLITCDWLYNNYNIVVKIRRLFLWNNSLPLYNQWYSTIYDYLSTHVNNIPLHHHTNNIMCGVYIVGNNMHILLRSSYDYD